MSHEQSAQELRSDLEELSSCAVSALVHEERRLVSKLGRLEKVTRSKYPSLHALEIDDTRRALEAMSRGLSIARKYDPMREAILSKLERGA